MDGNLVLMIVAVTFIGCAAGAYSDWQKTKRARLKDGADSDSMARLKADIDRLEERVRVLERIQTDPSERLKRELETL